MKFHHHGLAVRKVEPARQWLAHLKYELQATVYDPIQLVHVQLATHSECPTVELVWSDHEKSPLYRWLKTDATSLYHTCYEVESIEETVKLLLAKGKCTPIGEAQPAVLFNGRLIQFIHLRGLGLIELLETDG